MTPPGRWHPLRSDPGLAAGLTVWRHALSIVMAMVATVVVGLALAFVGNSIEPVWPDGGGVLFALGAVIAFSVMFSWAGHLPGAFILHALLRSGWAGWVSAMLGGLVVGCILGVAGGVLTITIGPLLALVQLICLRWLLPSPESQASDL